MHPDAAPTFVTLPYERTHDLPDRFDGEGYVRTPPPYVEHFLDRFTAPGDVVLDPFAGFGTTLAVAERMDRRAYGVEYEADRAAYARERVTSPDRVHHGSAFDLPGLTTHDPDAAAFALPPVDCCLTSPPYSTEVVDGDLPEIPFFKMDTIQIRGTETYALSHGMAAMPGLEIFGPHDIHDEVLATLQKHPKRPTWKHPTSTD